MSLGVGCGLNVFSCFGLTHKFHKIQMTVQQKIPLNGRREEKIKMG